MKKIFYSFAVCLMILSSAIFTACGKGDPKSISVKEGTLATTVLVNEELDYSDVVLNVTYENGDVEEIEKNNEMTFTGFDKTKVGKQTITIGYLNLTTEFEITVVVSENETYDIIGFEKPAFYVLHEANKEEIVDNPQTSDFDENEEEFVVRDYAYKVGDDNPFVFLPNITALKVENGVPSEIKLTEYTSDVVIELKEDSNVYTKLTDNITNYVLVDNAKSSFDFTDAAIGKTFRITVRPVTASEDIDSIVFEVEVVNGYNAYDVKELSLIDNNEGTESAWSELKQSWSALDGKDYTQTIDGIVLHNNMTVTKDYVPTSYFYHNNDGQGGNEENDGSLKVRKTFYTRDIASDKKFSIYGNYFTIDSSQIALTEEFESEAYGHSSVIAFGGDNDGSPSTLQGEAYVESLKLRGNAPRSEVLDVKGGMIACITNAKKVVFENCATRAFVTHLIALEGENNVCTLQNSKMIDSFSTMYFMWGSKYNNIINSVLKGSGGPLVMATHVDPDKNTTKYSNVNIENSVLEAPVIGTEGWFELNDASPIATQIKALGLLFETVSTQLKTNGLIDYVKGFVNKMGTETDADDKMNFLSVMLSNGIAVQNTSPLYGATTLKDAEGNVVSEQDMTEIKGIFDAYPALKVLPFFKSNGVVMTLTVDGAQKPNGLALVDKTTGAQTSVTEVLTNLAIAKQNPSSFTQDQLITLNSQKDMIVNFFNGSYMHLYYNGTSIGATFDFYSYDNNMNIVK